VIQKLVGAAPASECQSVMPLREPIPPEGKAWLRGERIAGVKLLYNQRVRVISGPDAGALGWIVAVDVRTAPEPIYTVEIQDGNANPTSAVRGRK